MYKCKRPAGAAPDIVSSCPTLEKTGTDRDSSTRQSVSPNICLLDTSALLLCATQREEKNFSLFLMVSSLYRIEETSSSGRKLSTTAQLSQTRLMEINDGIQLVTRINQSKLCSTVEKRGLF
jgi:hypothetical protein